jgi:ribonuclease G
VSQKIREREEKDRLKKLVRGIKPKGFGVIIRTVAKGQTAEDLQADLDSLIRKWKTLHRGVKRTNKPVRIFREMNRASAFLRDVFNDNFVGITVDEQDLFDEVKRLYRGHQTRCIKNGKVLQRSDAVVPVRQC